MAPALTMWLKSEKQVPFCKTCVFDTILYFPIQIMPSGYWCCQLYQYSFTYYFTNFNSFLETKVSKLKFCSSCSCFFSLNSPPPSRKRRIREADEENESIPDFTRSNSPFHSPKLFIIEPLLQKWIPSFFFSLHNIIRIMQPCSSQLQWNSFAITVPLVNKQNLLEWHVRIPQIGRINYEWEPEVPTPSRYFNHASICSPWVGV